MSPTLHTLAICLKQEARQTLGQAICILQFRWAFLDLQPTFRVSLLMEDKAVEEMQFALEAPASWSELLVGSQEKGSLVVLKDLTRHLKLDAIQRAVGRIGRVVG